MTRKVLVVLGVVLFVDVVRTWLPTIITVFGQAASTPAELMGAFALLWFVLALGAPLVAGVRLFPLAAGLVLAGCRIAVLFTAGQVHLYVASFGLLAGLCWLVSLAMRGTSPRWVAVGVAVAAVEHALVWRGLVGGFLAVATAAGFLVASFGDKTAIVVLLKQGDARERGPATGWFLVGPLMFLALQTALSPAVVTTGVSYAIGGSVAVSGGPAAAAAAVALTAVAVLAFTYLVLRPPAAAWARWLCAVALVAAAAAFTYGPGWLFVVVVPVMAAALGGCAGVAFSGAAVSGGGGDRPVLSGAAAGAGGDRPVPPRGYAAAAGLLVFSVAAFAYYAAYDLGYPNAWVPPVIALVVAVAAVRAGGAPETVALPRLAYAVVPAAVLLLVSAGAWWVPPRAAPGGGPAELRVVAYNIRMAFDLDGRFSAERLADVIRAERPDVVFLSEVDRAWLLNGGHDDVQILARDLGMRYGFAPAADAVWGDAILTNLPVVSWHAERMPSYGAVTGAQVLGAVLRRGPGTVAVVSTHLQPPPGRPPLEQARDVARFAAGLKAPGRPVIVGGDFNTRPGEEPFEALLAGGFTDAFAARRPVNTSPADAPRQEIDHVFVAGGQARDISAPRSTASDHLAVAVTITW